LGISELFEMEVPQPEKPPTQDSTATISADPDTTLPLHEDQELKKTLSDWKCRSCLSFNLGMKENWLGLILGCFVLMVLANLASSLILVSLTPPCSCSCQPTLVEPPVSNTTSHPQPHPEQPFPPPTLEPSLIPAPPTPKRFLHLYQKTEDYTFLTNFQQFLQQKLSDSIQVEIFPHANFTEASEKKTLEAHIKRPHTFFLHVNQIASTKIGGTWDEDTFLELQSLSRGNTMFAGVLVTAPDSAPGHQADVSVKSGVCLNTKQPRQVKFEFRMDVRYQYYPNTQEIESLEKTIQTSCADWNIDL